MTIASFKAIAAALVLISVPFVSLAADDDDKARGQFEDIFGSHNDSKNSLVKRAINRTDFIRRVYSVQALDAETKKSFNDGFWDIVGASLFGDNLYANTKDGGAIVEFSFKDGNGRAVVRYKLPQYHYAFQVWQLRHTDRGRLKVVDRFDSSKGQLLSVGLSDELALRMPNRTTTRRLLSIANPSDQQIFQVTEILKAARDQQGPRFFEIYDGLDAQVRKEPFIINHALKLAFAIQDADRFRAVLQEYYSVNNNNPDVALIISSSYFTLGDYEKSYLAMQHFYEHFALPEGAIPARLSALALVLGKNEQAEQYAREATANEPGLELGWWSLLRARSQMSNFDGAVEALTHLEDDFGHTLDAANLRRDRFRGFAVLSESDAFKDWRSNR